MTQDAFIRDVSRPRWSIGRPPQPAYGQFAVDPSTGRMEQWNGERWDVVAELVQGQPPYSGADRFLLNLGPVGSPRSGSPGPGGGGVAPAPTPTPGPGGTAPSPYPYPYPIVDTPATVVIDPTSIELLCECVTEPMKMLSLALTPGNEPVLTGNDVIPFDEVVLDTDSFVNTVALDSGEHGPGTVPVGAAYVHPAGIGDWWVATVARGTPNSVEAEGMWISQLGILKNLETMGSGSSRFDQIGVLAGDGAGNILLPVVLPYGGRLLQMTAGDYLYVNVGTNLTPGCLLSDNAEFSVFLVRRV